MRVASARRLACGGGALVLVLLVVAGCTPIWDRPNTTREQVNYDSYTCQHESYVAPPREREALYKLCMKSRGYRETDPDADRPRR